MPEAHAPAPTQTPTQQQPDPCTTPEPTPDGDDTPDQPCPKPKPCAEWPKPPCPPRKPNPCDPDDDECDDDDEPPPPTTGDCCELPTSTDPVTQLGTLQQQLKTEQRQAEQLERVKTSIDDLKARIDELQKMLDGKPALVAAFKDFYRNVDVTKSEIACFIPTVRCQLNLTDAEKDCIRTAIRNADNAIAKAKADLASQKSRVDRYQARWERASWKLAHAKLLYDFFDHGLKDATQAKRDDLLALKPLADPSKDRCLAEFYLREMEAQLKSCYGGGKNECCFPPHDLTIGSFLDCWSDGCYLEAYSRALVEFNEAEWEEKCRKTLLDAATARVADLQKAYDDLVAKRRDTIVAAIKAAPCCKSC